MDFDKLRALVELSQRGTMSAVAAATGFGTSAVSQQLTALQRQVGVPLIEADGRRVRLTPAGRRLADHGRDILAAVTAAQLDVAARADPHGPVRIAGYATALQGLLIPAVAELARRYPAVRLELQEGEPPEVLSLLDDDRIDLGFVYDYTLVPRTWRHPGTLLHTSPMVLAVPEQSVVPDRISTAEDLASLRDERWVANSRDSADDELTERLCALAGWIPTIAHRVDSLDLVVDLVLAGQGVSVLVGDAPQAGRVRTVPLDVAGVRRRMWSVQRAGSGAWPATRAVLDHIVGRLPPPA